MHTWYLISVFLHITFAALWIGGMLFLPLVLLPSIKHHPDRVALLYKTGVQFRWYGWAAMVVLALTGLSNLILRGVPLTWHFLLKSEYGTLLQYKLAFFLLLLLISGLHDFLFGRKALEEMQQGDNRRLKLFARWSGRINLLLSLAIAFIGVVLSRGGVWP